MKKLLIGAIIGGIIVFVWQTLSWTVLNLHESVQKYSPKQDSLMKQLQGQFDHEGTYILPNMPPGSSFDDMKKLDEQAKGKPWYVITYHKAYNINRGANILRGLLVNIVMMLLVCWMFMQFSKPTFGVIFGASVAIGVVSFIFYPYTGHIWYPTAGIHADFHDALVAWALAGVWLGFWLKEK